MKKAGNDEKLDKLTKRFPENKEIAKAILEKLEAMNVYIPYKVESCYSLILFILIFIFYILF